MPFEQIPAAYYRYTLRGVERVDGPIIGESHWTLYVNGEELVTFMCTPRGLHHLALGFCRNEGLIDSLQDVRSLRVFEDEDRCYCFIPGLGLDETISMRVCEESVGRIDLRLKRLVSLPAHRVLTSGCGGGTTFQDLASAWAPLESSVTATAEQVFSLMRELNARAELYRAARGVHTSLLCVQEGTLILAEDVGRHNTLDKIRGECLIRGISTDGGVLVTSGRISSEMITKAAKMRVPIVVSRTSPTWLSRQLAEQWNITAIGYARGHQMNVYTHPWRIIPVGASAAQPATVLDVAEEPDRE